MWCYIRNNDVGNFLNQYPSLNEFWEEIVLLKTSNALILPRLMYKSFPSDFLNIHNASNSEYEKVNIKFNAKLRDIQKDASSKILSIFLKDSYVNGILKLPPGTGKTVLAIYLISKLGLKACIVLDNSELLKQWVKTIINFTNLTEDDIGIIKGKIKVINKPITIAMTQSLLSKIKKNIISAYDFIKNSKFGIVIFDEVHATSASEKFAQTSILFSTKNILGLSATPFHYGAAKILMENTIGSIIYTSNQYDLTPLYYFVYYKSDLQKYSFAMRKMNFIGKRAFYNKIIIKSEQYISLIKNYTNNLLKKGYRIIIMCMTIKQVNLISDELTKLNIVHKRVHASEPDTDAENDKVLVVTYKFVGKGFDMPKLSALILATPLAGKKSIIQVCGRILRSEKNKKQPIVVDLIDISFPFFFLPDVNAKKKIIEKEFNDCKIFEYTAS